MKNLILILLFAIISVALFAQNTTKNNYKNQIGFDIKPAINSFSGASTFPLFSEYDILYTRTLSPKYIIMAKIGYTFNENETITTRDFFPIDTLQIMNRLISNSHVKFHINFSRKITRKRMNFYYGITTGVNINRGVVQITEFEAFGFQSLGILNERSIENDFKEFVIAPNFSLELPINDRLQILVNFKIMGTVAFGRWQYLDRNEVIVDEPLYSSINGDGKILRDIGIMYRF